MGENTAETPSEIIDRAKSPISIETITDREIAPVETTKSELSPLPFTYERTYDPNSAKYHEWRVSPVRFGKEINTPKTDEEILDEIRKKREEEDWFTEKSWREKGLPTEQVEFEIDGRQITVYNWNKDKLFTDEHIQRAQRAFQELASRFPQILDQIRWVLIVDEVHTSAFGDPEKYPLNGYALPGKKAFKLLPRGMELIPHRVAKASNFEGTFTHESTHLIEHEFAKEWREKFDWEMCADHTDDWELRPSPDGKDKKWFNKNTGEMAANYQFPLQPDQCVTYYAKMNSGEDICDSMVAYIYDPELLQAVSPDKFAILQKHDAKRSVPEAGAVRVPKEEIKLPEVKPETVYYYIDEPK